MNNAGKRRSRNAERDAVLREVEEAERALASAGVEAEYAMDEARKARRIEEKARRRLALAEAKARAILNNDEQ